jgi:hypothetical protein
MIYSVNGMADKHARAAERQIADMLAAKWTRQYSQMAYFVQTRMCLGHLPQPKCLPMPMTFDVEQVRKVLQLHPVCDLLKRSPNLLRMPPRKEGVRWLLPRRAELQEPSVQGHCLNPSPRHRRHLLPSHVGGHHRQRRGPRFTGRRGDTTIPHPRRLGGGRPC